MRNCHCLFSYIVIPKGKVLREKKIYRRLRPERTALYRSSQHERCDALACRTNVVRSVDGEIIELFIEHELAVSRYLNALNIRGATRRRRHLYAAHQTRDL